MRTPPTHTPSPTFQILLQYESWFFQSHDWSGSTQHCVLNTLTGPQTLSEPENHQNSAPGNIMATVPRVQLCRLSYKSSLCSPVSFGRLSTMHSTNHSTRHCGERLGSPRFGNRQNESTTRSKPWKKC